MIDLTGGATVVPHDEYDVLKVGVVKNASVAHSYFPMLPLRGVVVVPRVFCVLLFLRCCSVVT